MSPSSSDSRASCPLITADLIRKFLSLKVLPTAHRAQMHELLDQISTDTNTRPLASVDVLILSLTEFSASPPIAVHLLTISDDPPRQAICHITNPFTRIQLPYCHTADGGKYEIYSTTNLRIVPTQTIIPKTIARRLYSSCIRLSRREPQDPGCTLVSTNHQDHHALVKAIDEAIQLAKVIQGVTLDSTLGIEPL
ncbi:hypothetical protein BT63DRAFT_421066 [Microthyrium microscopicum]|uniref:Uncharacterized protein n=1 Tax=Microthyrium microscopicum TaxID=703497 RepID=A0A6A6UPN4_9PEZI|nr:hypothetical protein BT63DRAFT_421066 [Microthyrium microscopicum]